MDTEFRLGYKKALEDLEKRFKENATDFYTKDFVNATFKDLVKEEKKRVQPVIYFTKLNKKTGELEYDREKTLRFAEQGMVEESPVETFDKSSNPYKLVKKGSKEYNKIIDLCTGKKTDEMLKAENKILWRSTDVDFNGISDELKYKNTLGQQLVQIAQGPNAAYAIYAAADLLGVAYEQVKVVDIAKALIAQHALLANN